MNILDAQSEDARRARFAIVSLLSRGAYLKAFYRQRGLRNGWGDYHLVIDGQRHEVNALAAKAVAESGKATIAAHRENGYVLFGDGKGLK